MSLPKNTETPQVAEPTVSLGQLTEVIRQIVAESRKPVVSDAEVKKIEARNAERKENAELQKELRSRELLIQKRCSHIRKDGTARTVFIPPTQPEAAGNYLICQYCFKIIRPEEGELFTRLFQMVAPLIDG